MIASLVLYVLAGSILTLTGLFVYIENGTMDLIIDRYRAVKDVHILYGIMMVLLYAVCLTLAIVTWPVALVWVFIMMGR